MFSVSHLQSCSHYIDMQDQMTENLKRKTNLAWKNFSRRNQVVRIARLKQGIICNTLATVVVLQI